MKNHRIQRVLIAAFCSTVFSASASDIQMFGFFDQGLAYLHEDLNAGMGGPAGQSINAPQYVDKDGYVAEAQTKRSFTQGSGNVSTWGIKGSEQINADVRVLFHLESGFLADDGTLYGGSVKPLFERESSIGVESKTWGLVKFGRMPALSTGSGTTGILNSKVNPFGAGWGNMTGGWKFAGTLAAARHVNTPSSRHPTMVEKGRLKRIAGGLSAHRWRAESTTSQPQWIVLMPRAVRPSLKLLMPMMLTKYLSADTITSMSSDSLGRCST